jgi:hypothetical protein
MMICLNQKLVQTCSSDLLMRQMVENQLDSPNFAQSNDIPIKLITGVKFLRQLCFKSCIII